MSAALRIHIDEVVLHGLAPADRAAFERALTQELARRLQESDFAQSSYRDRVRAMPVDAADLGRDLARSVAAVLDASSAGEPGAQR